MSALSKSFFAAAQPLPVGGRPLRALAACTLAAAALLSAPLDAAASVRHAVAPVRRAPLSPLHTHGKQHAEPAEISTKRSAKGGHAKNAGDEHTADCHGRHVAMAEERSTPRHRAKSHDGERETAQIRHGNSGSAVRFARRDDPRDDDGGSALHRKRRPAEQQASRDEDATADDGARDRVHAWYKTHRAATTVASVSAPAKPTRTPDLSTTAPKATAADFDRAAAAQRMTIRSVAEQNSKQTTAADDAADAESRIPSTAPTEREPAPFVHGDALPAGIGTSRRTTAPVVRQPARPSAVQSASAAPAQNDETLDLSPPAAVAAQPVASRVAHPDLSAVRVQASGGKAIPDAKVLAAIPVATAGDSSPRAVRAIALETAASPTPQLQLPSPPVAGRKPAIAAVQAGARHPVLDPAVSTGMAQETFDGDDVPATANTAIQLATAGVPLRAKAIDDGAPAMVVPVTLFDGRGQLILLPPMKGSHEILVHQNQMAVSDGLERVQNDRQLADMHRLKLLVDLPDDDSIYPNDALPLNRRYARPWTVRFLRDMARAHYTRFGTPLIVTSAVRTVEFQRRLVRINGNAAPPTGDIASPHLYGQAIDIAKRGMSLTEITWMRAYLGPVEDQGKIDVEEEFQQACFHVSVYRRYLGPPPAKQKVGPPALLQAKAPVAPEPTPSRHRLPTALLATHLP